MRQTTLPVRDRQHPQTRRSLTPQATSLYRIEMKNRQHMQELGLQRRKIHNTMSQIRSAPLCPRHRQNDL